MSLRINSDFNGVTDPDAGAYIAAVEAADGQLLEFAVGKAINDFVVGCKADGIWNAIKASCILAGARKKEGAFIDLKTGTQILTNNGFADGDYNRKTGLVGNGSSKYINSNRAANADPRDNYHVSIYASTADSSSGTFGYDYIGANSSGVPASSQVAIGRYPDGGFGYSTSRNSTGYTNASLLTATGFLGHSRASSSSFATRFGAASVSSSIVSIASSTNNIFVFARSTPANTVAANSYSNGRLAFYSIGESLDLAKLDARVTALINAFGAAIP